MSDNSSIPLSCPDITEAEIQAVVAVLRSNRLSIGPHLEAFEGLVAARAHRRFGIAVNSGTSGLHLCVRALGISDGDEVITTPFTFIATTNSVLFERAKPVFVDIDPVSYNMDPALIESAITPRTKAIMPVEVFGNMSHFEEYERIAAKHDLAMIEDCCEAIGAVSGPRNAGSFGDCGVFAFYPNKQITTGEGGMIVTDNETLAGLCRSMRNQGRDDGSSWFGHDRMGFNYRLDELSAAIGEIQMLRLDEILAKRRAVAAEYNRALAGIAEIIPPPCQDQARASWFVYVIRLSDRFCQADREEVMNYLIARGIGCQRYFVPIHLHPWLQKRIGCRAGDYPVCEETGERTISLPFFANMRPEQVSRVVECLKSALVNRSRKVKR